MPDAPTTEGSIVAYLRLNTSDWDAKLDEAEQKARELGRVDPNIRVNADVAEAMAKLEALRAAEKSIGGVDLSASGSGASKIDEVAAAQKRLTAAMQAADVAYARAELSAMRLNDVESKRGRTETQVAAALLANAEAQRRLDAANDKATVAEEALAAAKARNAAESDRLTVAALREAAAVDAERNATDKANQSHQGSISRMGLIVGAVLAAVPVMGQAAGAAVGLAGGFAGMGAAGVLAILGIRNEMAQGTAAGNEYSAGIQLILGDLHQLESTAAAGVLNGFNSSIDAVHSNLPALNDEIRVFSGELGTAGGIVTNGVVTALRIMNPLFVQAGFYVEQLAAGFMHWTKDGGLRQFTQDAIVALPQVTNALGALLHGVLALIQAFSPLGPVFLGVITLIGNLLSLLGMLGPALPPIVAGAAAALAIFLQWDAIAPVLENVAWKLGEVGLAADIAAGPVGWIIGAASLLAIGLAGIAVAAGQATQATQNYSAAVQQDNGVVGESVKLQAAKALGATGALAATEKLGIATKILTDATTGNTGAQSKLKAELDAATVKLKASELALQENSKATGTQIRAVDANRAALKLVTEQYNQNKISITDALKAYNDVAQAQGLATIKTKDQLKAQTDLAATYGMTLPQMLAAQGAQQKNADSAANTTRQLQLENDAASLLTNAFTLLNGGTLNVAQAQTGAAAASNTLLDSLKQNGTEIDGNTKAAVANQQALQQKAQADQQAAEAIAKQTGSTEAGTAAFGASKQALIDQLKAAGNLTPAIQALIDKYYAVPPVVKTRAELDADAAAAKAAALKADLDRIARDWTASVHIVTDGKMPTAGHFTAQATGGPVHGTMYRAGGGGIDYLAGGGQPFFKPQGTDTVPTMLTVGEFVVKEPSARYDPQFMKAYNSNPAAALDSVRRQGDKSGSSNRPIYADGIGLIGWIREVAGQQAQLVFNRGINGLAAQIQGGAAV